MTLALCLASFVAGGVCFWLAALAMIGDRT